MRTCKVMGQWEKRVKRQHNAAAAAGVAEIYSHTCKRKHSRRPALYDPAATSTAAEYAPTSSQFHLRNEKREEGY